MGQRKGAQGCLLPLFRIRCTDSPVASTSLQILGARSPRQELCIKFQDIMQPKIKLFGFNAALY